MKQKKAEKTKKMANPKAKKKLKRKRLQTTQSLAANTIVVAVKRNVQLVMSSSPVVFAMMKYTTTIKWTQKRIIKSIDTQSKK
jgi:hypothetical protein